MRRVSSWQHPAGEACSIESLADAFAPHHEDIVKKNIDIYDSNDFKVGINTRLLQENLPLLKSLVAVGRRGGIFLHSQMASALAKAIEKVGQPELLLEKAVEHGKTFSEMLELIVYKIRVMLAHSRICYDNHATDGKNGLDSLFVEMNDVGDAVQMDSRKQRRISMLSKRLYHFVCFRNIQHAAGEDDNDDEVTVVSKYLDGKTRTAKMLRSDGCVINADKYTAGANGFVCALWMHDGSTLELELPNSCLDETTGELKQWSAAQPHLAKKPAAKQEASEPEDEGDNYDDDVADSEEIYGVLKLKPGHRNSQCISLQTTSKDKAQLIEVTPGMCKEGQSPRSVCESLLEMLKAEGAALVLGPVKGSPNVEFLRERAKKFRAELVAVGPAKQLFLLEGFQHCFEACRWKI